MAIPAIIAAAMRAAGMGESFVSGAGSFLSGLGGQAAPKAANVLPQRVPTLTGWQNASNPPPLPGQKTPPLLPAEKAKEFTDRMQRLGGTFKDVNAQVAFANINLHQFSAAAQAIPHRFVSASTAAIDALRAAAEPFVHLVQGANPAVAKQWELAIRDAYGVLGRLYIPVVQAATVVARNFGHTLAGLEPVFRPAIRSIAYLASTIGNEVNAAVRDNAGTFKVLATALSVAAAEAAVAAKAIRFFSADLRLFMGLPMALFGGGGDFNKNAKGTGAGVRSARQVTSAQEISDEAIKNALIMGTGNQSREDKQTGILDKLGTALRDLVKWLEEHEPTKEKARETAPKIANPWYGLYSLLRTS